jgi:hypothetical protein
MRDAHDWPKRLCFALSFVGFVFSVTHLLSVVIQNLLEKKSQVNRHLTEKKTYRLYLLKPFWWLFGAAGTNLWHSGMVALNKSSAKQARANNAWLPRASRLN